MTIKTNKKIEYENASSRKSYVGEVYDVGEKAVKEQIIKSLPINWAKLHESGHIHIHDLDAYERTYNCLTFNILNKFPCNDFKNQDDIRKILGVFDYYKLIITKIGNEQSGGMGFANFDLDTAMVFYKLDITDNEINREIIRNSIGSLIYWLNNTHERMGQVSYYVTLNIGLANNDLARFICEKVIEEFADSPKTVFKPNIVFKVKSGVNRFPEDPNFYLLEKSLLCTAKKMIPTYVLGDSESNKDTNIIKLAVMGCRTKVVKNLHGEEGSIGRGNLSNITINLPRLALEIMDENLNKEEAVKKFKDQWLLIANDVHEILRDRYQKLIDNDKNDFPTNMKYDLWSQDFSAENNTLEDIFQNGTLAIGFIGLSETIELLTGKKYWQDEETYEIALDIVSFMRRYCDELCTLYRLNFSLLATSGELISGRFPNEDNKLFAHEILKKGYYTNSFHVDVDSEIAAFDKIEIEGKFHSLCNGGCITYVELGESPLGNKEGLMELVEHSIKSGVHYLGFNFPLDICNDCNENGVFDVCGRCGGNNITRIRRVSGYLENLDYFTYGKKSEVENRKRN